MNRTTKVPKGFEISFNERYHLLTIRAWGFWDKDFSRKCCRMLSRKILETGQKHANWSLLLDVKELHPQSPEFEYLAEKQIESAKAQFVQKIGILETSQLESQLLALKQKERQDTVRIGKEKDILDWLTQSQHS